MPQKFFQFFRTDKHAFKYVFIMDLEHVRCLTIEESSVEHGVMCCKDSEM
jgi:hypothetical protein